MAEKVLKFRGSAVELIKSGESTITWRLFDDKDLSIGDELDLINADTDEKFAEAQIISVEEKRMADLGDDDYDGVERFDAPEEMYAAYGTLYDEEVGPDTMVKVIRFDVVPAIDEDELEEELEAAVDEEELE